MAISSGTRLGRYEIRSQIGAGGMGEVYLADDTLLRRKVALKLLPAGVAENRERLGRFEQEAFTASALNHPNIVTVFEIGEADSSRFIATEYVDGETLRQRMKRSRLTVREALDIAGQIASALAAAHKAGVVHRDIKPENVMIRHDDGIVKVLDFGLAKATERLAQASGEDLEAATRAMVNTGPGVVIGTASYMSPEQARGLTVDERTDIWSLGVVLYEMIAGRVPFEGQTPSDAISMILHKEPPALTRLSDEATERLDEIVTKALAKNRDERYQVAKDLLIDLRRLKQHLDFESEVDRTFAPEFRKSAETPPVADLTGQSAPPSAAISAAQSASISGAVPTRASSAEYIVTGIRRHQKFVLAAAGVLAVALVVVVSYLWISSRRAHALTDKDTILVADFVNTTGDPVFDGTLKQALAVQLEQSPFLNIFGDDRVREALRFMGRSPDERLTRDIAREICQRQAIKALLAGAISGLGSHYVITLEAVNAQSGDTIAREQAEAENKEQVLKRLGEAATKLREKLGESLASIKKFDAPLEEATTSSLEALKAYSMGRELSLKGKDHEAIPFLKRAVELDPNFAKAYNSLAVSYNNTRQLELAIENYQKAFDLRERASEHEKLKIAADYYGAPAIGEIEKSIEAYELLTRTYPRDAAAWNNLGVTYNSIGQFEKAAEACREGIRLNPNWANAPANLARAFIGLNRLDEAKQVIEEALAQKLESTLMHSSLHSIAFVQGDAVAMKHQIDWITGRPDEYEGQGWQAQVAAFSGQLRKEREFNQRAVELALQHEQKEVAAGFIVNQAGIEAFFGHCDQVSGLVSKAFDILRSTSAVRSASAAFSFCGDSGHAQPLMDELLKRFPNATFQNIVFVPLSRAEIALHNGTAAQAIELLESAHRFESVGGFTPQYVRGQAYLKLNKGAEAAAEFQKILDHRGWYPRSVLFPLAYLGLARAAALTGDTAKARKAYQDFFALWKDADADIPILVEAKKEYEKLK